MSSADQPGVMPEPAPAGVTFPGTGRGYISQFDSFRVIACCAVVLQHSLLWNVQAGNTTAWAFVMLLHFSRTAFFFLAAFLLTYSQITRPRSTVGFWRRRYVQLGVPFLAWTLIYWVFSMVTGNSWDQAWSLLWNDTVYGYYQLYFAVVLLLLYAAFPLVLRVLRASSHHGAHHARQLAVRTVVGGGPPLHRLVRRGGRLDARHRGRSGPGPATRSHTRSSSWRAFWSPSTSTRCVRSWSAGTGR